MSTYILVVFSVGNNNFNGGHVVGSVCLHRGAHAVLQQLQQHVADVGGHVGEGEVCTAQDDDLWRVAVGARAHVGGVLYGLSGVPIPRCSMLNIVQQVPFEVWMRNSQRKE
jgi:hypothetical protein